MGEAAATNVEAQAPVQTPAQGADAAAAKPPTPLPSAPKRKSVEDRAADAVRVAQGEALEAAAKGDESGSDKPTLEAQKPAEDAAKAPPPGKEWKALRAREKALVEKERSFDTTRSQLEGQIKELGQKASRVDRLAELAKSDPIGLLEEFGISIEALSAHYLDAQKPDALAKREVQKALEAERKQREEAEAKARAEAEATQREATAKQRAAAQQECLFLAGREAALHGFSPAQILEAASLTATEMLRTRPEGFAVKDVVAEMVRRLAPPTPESAPQAADEPQSSPTPTGKGAPRAPKPGSSSLTQARASETTGKTRRESFEERMAAAIRIAQGALARAGKGRHGHLSLSRHRNQHAQAPLFEQGLRRCHLCRPSALGDDPQAWRLQRQRRL